jgi:hypothetical protein
LILSFVVPRRSVTQNRGEEVTRAVVWVTGPLVIAALWLRFSDVVQSWGTWADIEIVTSGLYSTSFFDSHQQQFFPSLHRVAAINVSLLWRLYFLVLIFACLLNVAIIRYRWLRSVIKPGWAKAALATLLLPRVSEWHVLLSDMLLPTDDVTLAVDVLTKSGTLYQGAVQDRMLASDGSLLSLTLADPRRFLRDDFHKAKEVDLNAKTDAYWRSIPGKLFVILGNDIASVNVRYPPRNATSTALDRRELSPEEVDAVRNLLSKLTAPEDAT